MILASTAALLKNLSLFSMICCWDLQAGAFFYRNLAIASCLKLAQSHEEALRAQEVQHRPKLLRAVLRLQGNSLVLAFDTWRATVRDSRQRPGVKGMDIALYKLCVDRATKLWRTNTHSICLPLLLPPSLPRSLSPYV